MTKNDITALIFDTEYRLIYWGIIIACALVASLFPIESLVLQCLFGLVLGLALSPLAQRLAGHYSEALHVILFR